MKKSSYLRSWLMIIVFALLIFASAEDCSMPSMKRAYTRAQLFVNAVNTNRPAEVYCLLDPTIASLTTRKQFIANFTADRAYPYLTPLYLYIDKMELAPDRYTGVVYCTVAARLPGQTMVLTLHWYRGDYYMTAFREIADGSFRTALHRLPGK